MSPEVTKTVHDPASKVQLHVQVLLRQVKAELLLGKFKMRSQDPETSLSNSNFKMPLWNVWIPAIV